jgi:hypothetical protein
MLENENFNEAEKPQLNIGAVSGSLPSRKAIRQIIELTATITSRKDAVGNNKKGDVWGMDCFLGNIDKLIDKIEKIISNDR